MIVVKECIEMKDSNKNRTIQGVPVKDLSAVTQTEVDAITEAVNEALRNGEEGNFMPDPVRTREEMAEYALNNCAKKVEQLAHKCRDKDIFIETLQGRITDLQIKLAQIRAAVE